MNAIDESIKFKRLNLLVIRREDLQMVAMRKSKGELSDNDILYRNNLPFGYIENAEVILFQDNDGRIRVVKDRFGMLPIRNVLPIRQ